MQRLPRACPENLNCGAENGCTCNDCKRQAPLGFLRKGKTRRKQALTAGMYRSRPRHLNIADSERQGIYQKRLNCKASFSIISIVQFQQSNIATAHLHGQTHCSRQYEQISTYQHHHLPSPSPHALHPTPLHAPPHPPIHASFTLNTDKQSRSEYKQPPSHSPNSSLPYNYHTSPPPSYSSPKSVRPYIPQSPEVS